MILNGDNLELYTVYFPQSQKYNDHSFIIQNFRVRSVTQCTKLATFSAFL
jgi:hypothetical protein